LTEPFALHLPVGTATLYQQRIAEIPEDRRTQWRYHRVAPEDTLASVAQSFHVSVEQLAQVNQLDKGVALSSVESLVVPVAPAASPATRKESYKARRGDTLVTIADRFGVSLDELRRWNHLSGNAVGAGQKIRVEAPVLLAPRGHEKAHGSSGSSRGSTAEKSAQASKGGSEKSAASKEKAGAGEGGTSSRSYGRHRRGSGGSSTPAGRGGVKASQKIGEAKPAAKSGGAGNTKKQSEAKTSSGKSSGSQKTKSKENTKK